MGPSSKTAGRLGLQTAGEPAPSTGRGSGLRTVGGPDAARKAAPLPCPAAAPPITHFVGPPRFRWAVPGFVRPSPIPAGVTRFRRVSAGSVGSFWAPTDLSPAPVDLPRPPSVHPQLRRTFPSSPALWASPDSGEFSLAPVGCPPDFGGPSPAPVDLPWPHRFLLGSGGPSPAHQAVLGFDGSSPIAVNLPWLRWTFPGP